MFRQRASQKLIVSRRRRRAQFTNRLCRRLCYTALFVLLTASTRTGLVPSNLLVLILRRQLHAFPQVACNVMSDSSSVRGSIERPPPARETALPSHRHPVCA